MKKKKKQKKKKRLHKPYLVTISVEKTFQPKLSTQEQKQLQRELLEFFCYPSA